ncbi:hypothetical protein FKG94_04425 [Exilibacterium tricleocarpae]|uniref:DUF2214 family protein n=1 Tax=Exilibacterium tricleocarpae TaxID=2591008 RepID=A0A545U5U9_9GAMM|nr:hypothetical protein FKG94_04425 [Exilibacterium tricleocarpae]
MSAYELTLLIHILLFCYWLGGDVGVFYSSRFVVDPRLCRETRLTAARIMLGCDLIPKICMSLMLTAGGLLTEFNGIAHPPWQMAAIVLLGPVWLSLVLVLHFKHNAAFIPALTRIDFHFRWLVILALVVSCIYSITSGRLAEAPWVVAKLLAFAFLIFCGLMIRVNLKGFSATYAKLVRDSYTDADNQLMIRSLARVKPWVITIWVVLVVQAVLGIAKPGATSPPVPTGAALVAK